MEEDAQRSTDSNAYASFEIKNPPTDAIDNDVVIVNKSIPEIVVSDTNCDFSSTFEDLSATEKENIDLKIKRERIDYEEADVKIKSDEEHFADFVVLDDDNYPSETETSDIKIEQEGLPADCLDIEGKALPDWGFPLKSETKPKINENSDNLNVECDKKVKVKIADQSVTKPNAENLKTFFSPKKELKSNVVSVRSSLGSSLASNETFVLQLDATDDLESYLDKTTNESPNKTDSKKVGGSLIDDTKENDSGQLNVVPIKVVEVDSLILTADGDLETEMLLGVRDKNEKVQNNVPEQKCKLLSENSKPTEEVQKGTNLETKPKLSSTDIKKDESPTTDKRNSLAELKPISAASEKSSNIKSDLKKCLISASKRSDLQGGTSRILWVSNVTQSVKATDLKQYISKAGKVLTAKVVTDGKKCYGYVVMDNPDDANECLRTLNNAHFEGKRISLSLTRPAKSLPDKNKDVTKSETDKCKSPKEEKVVKRSLCNDTDDNKVSKSKEVSKPSKSDTGKRHRSASKSRSERSSKRHNSNDPLTTKFGSKRRDHRSYKQKSRSSDRHVHKDYLRERMERDRLKRKLMDEQRKNRDEMLRQVQREKCEMEFRLEHERRKLQLERELFERERRELTRLDVERRKIEKERLEVLQQRTKLEEEFQKNRSKRKIDEFNLCSTIVKPQEFIKPYDKRKEVPKANDDYRKQYEKPDSKHQFQKSTKDLRDDRKILGDIKNSLSANHRNALKPERNDFKSGKDNAKNSKRNDDFKNYERSAPPPPKLNNDFDLSTTRKIKHDYKHEHADRKSDRGRKIEVIDRKYYQERGNENSDRRQERVYRKPELSERKYEYGREVKRYREEGYAERDNTQRTQWSASVNYNDPWKPTLPSTPAVSSPVRYQEGNFPAPSYGGPSRIPPFYYHPTPPVQEYPRYDHCTQVTGRKY